MLSKRGLSKLLEDSTDVYKRNIVDRYLIKLKNVTIFVMHCSLNGISWKQNQLRMIHN